MENFFNKMSYYDKLLQELDYEHDPANPDPFALTIHQLARKSGGRRSKGSKAGKNSLTETTQEAIVKKLLIPDAGTRRIGDAFQRAGVKSGHATGLESLEMAHRRFTVIRRPENVSELSPSTRLLAFAQYDILNDEGRQLFIAVEETSKRAVRWTRDARLFQISMYDHNCQKVMTIERRCTIGYCCAQYYCCCCTFGFKGCGNMAMIKLTQGDKVLGRVEQKFSFGDVSLQIYDELDRHIMNVNGKLIDGIFDIHLTVEGEEDPVAMVETSMNVQEVRALYKINITADEDPYGVTLYKFDVSPKYKAQMIAAIILMDFILCKPNTDYPHWAQFIPADYQPHDQTWQTLFRDGSKEIVITSIKPRHNRLNTFLGGRKCGCCGWFCSIICMCCPIAIIRNRLRCVHFTLFCILVVAGVIALLLIIFLVPKK